MTIQEFVDSLTSDQYIALLNRVYGPVPADIQAMTDDQILLELEKATG